MNEEWDKVTVLRKKPVTNTVLRNESALNAAKRSGVEVVAEKKTQVKSSLDAGKAAKIDRETEVTQVY
jgi:hypothetical protein